ncbi:MAG: hypothetical protein AAGA86_06655 [Bacteroidota bacterium]
MKVHDLHSKTQFPFKGITRRILVVLLIVFLYSCGNRVKSKIHLEGTWKIDSTYTYYNGFEQLQQRDIGEWPVYLFENGIAREIKSGTYRSFFYDVQEDTLVMTPAQGGEPIHFTILHLRKEILTLKKIKTPIFKGSGQNRYEIRYFSRTEPPRDSLILFGDPRKTKNQ